MSDLSTMQAIMKPWVNAQRPMNETTRWGNFPDYGQTLLMHSNSVPWVAEWVMSVLLERYTIDEGLIFRAFMVHDHGEPLTGGDEHIDAQTVGKDIKEWYAFETLVANVPTVMKSRLLHAFALQYVRKDSWLELPDYIQPIIQRFRKDKCIEAIVFDFIEKLDYLFTAFDGNLRKVRNKDEEMLTHALRHNAPKLSAMCKELPALKLIWTNSLQDELHNLAVGH